MAGRQTATVRVMQDYHDESIGSTFTREVDIIVSGLSKAEAEQAAMSVHARVGSDARLFAGRADVTPELALRLVREALARRAASKKQIAAERSSR